MPSGDGIPAAAGSGFCPLAASFRWGAPATERSREPPGSCFLPFFLIPCLTMAGWQPAETALRGCRRKLRHPVALHNISGSPERRALRRDPVTGFPIRRR